jgi:hypothetical protein
MDRLMDAMREAGVPWAVGIEGAREPLLVTTDPAVALKAGMNLTAILGDKVRLASPAGLLRFDLRKCDWFPAKRRAAA